MYLLTQPLVHEFEDVFLDDLPPGLPPIRDIEHPIDLLPRVALPSKPICRCNPIETELQCHVQKLVHRGYIRENMSSYSISTLLIPKKEGTMRMCVDSGAINKITVKYRCPIPSLNDMLEELHGADMLSWIDLRCGYSQIRMRDLG